MSHPNRNNDYNLNRSQQQIPGAARSSPTGERSAPVRIPEQQPVMRSVIISPAMRQQRTLHFEPALRRAEPAGGLRFPRGAGGPELHLASSGKQRQLFRDRRTKSDSSVVRGWRVEHVSLPGRPDDFPPLPRTSRVVRAASAHVVSSRISDCLQSRSIKARFSKADGNVAKCRNTDFCKFTIRLYSGEDGGVLVEVHRLSGDCISFMKDCRAVLNASEGKMEPHASDDKPLYLRLPVSEMAFLKTASLPPVSREEETDCVNITAELLSSRQSDTNMLGMESLVIQTDPLRSPKSTAVMASRMILCPNDQGNKSFNMHNYVMSLLIYGDEDDSPSAPEEDPAMAAIEDHSARLRNLAASALSNALSLLAAEGVLPAAVSPHREWYASVLIPRLIQDLSTAARHPHDACYASRCLSTLAESSVEFASKMRDEGGREATRNAEEVGAREFALLARDAGSCLKILSCCV